MHLYGFLADVDVTFPMADYGCFTVYDKFLGWPVKADPHFINCRDQILHVLVCYLAGGVPSSASINQVEDDKLLVEKQVAFHMLIKPFGEGN